MKAKIGQQLGLSLIEVMVALGIFLFVVITIWLFIKQGYDVQNFIFGQSTAVSEAQRGVEKLVKEAREALPSDTGAYALESANDFEFIFYADYDRDSAVERIRYYLEGSNFIKGIIEASGEPLQYLPEDEVTTIISRYVRNASDEPVFSYYDGDYSAQSGDTPLDTPAEVIDVRLVHIHLKINVYPDQAPKDFYLESEVQIRNLKDNL